MPYRQFAQAIIDTLDFEICVLNENGHIFAVNKAWCDFAESNGLPNFKWLGIDHLSILDSVEGPERPQALAIASAIREILQGAQISRSWKYLCPSKGIDRYFKLDLTGLPHEDLVRPILVHQDITEAEKLTQSHAKTLFQTTELLSKIIEQRDAYTAGHQHRVAELSKAIGTYIGLSEHQLAGLWLAASIHDVGKIHIPTEYLAKPIRLSETEFTLVKEHSLVGYEIVKHIDFDWPIADMILQHHERWNGTGYPNGLKQDSILIEARIIGVADVFEAMATHRPYRASLGPDAALLELLSNRGILYDPNLVDACMHIVKIDRFKFSN